jgi:ABC-type protease/lipase transport system fused ATPase/permease subunit
MGNVCSGLVDVVALELVVLGLVVLGLVVLGLVVLGLVVLGLVVLGLVVLPLVLEVVAGRVVIRSAARFPGATVEPIANWYEPSDRGVSWTLRYTTGIDVALRKQLRIPLLATELH